MADSNDTTKAEQIQTAAVYPYEMDDESFLLWIQTIGYTIEKLSEDSDGSPDYEIRHLAQIQRFLVGQMASIRNQSTAAAAV